MSGVFTDSIRPPAARLALPSTLLSLLLLAMVVAVQPPFKAALGLPQPYKQLFAEVPGAPELFSADIRTVPSDLPGLSFDDGLISIAGIKLAGFAAALVVGGALVLFLRHTRIGQAIRATAQNARAARVLGIDTDRVYATTFALNCAICGAAGGLVAMTWFVQPYLGLTYTLRSFMIVVAAGLGNLPGVIVAGSGLGVLEEFAGFVLGAEYQTAFIFLLLIALLIGRNLVLARQRKYLQ